MFRNLLQFFLLNKLLGGGGDGRPRRRGGIGCLGVILILVVLYFLYQYVFGYSPI